MLLSPPQVRPAGRVPAATARSRILQQHRMLRAQLQAGLALAKGALGNRGHSIAELTTLIDRTNQAFQCHLAEEEALLLPILDDDVPVGPWRASVLVDEHVRQRAELDALCATEQAFSIKELTRRYADLVQALLADMEAEERDLITPEIIRDDGVVIDQSSG